MSDEESDRESVDARWYFGGIAAVCSVCIVHPIDLIKTQVQAELRKTSSKQIFEIIVRRRGYQGLYHGLRSAISRQCTYTAGRFGLYEYAKNAGYVENSFWRKCYVASLSGFAMGLVTTPLTKVDFYVRRDAVKLPKNQKNYRNALSGLRSLHAEAGFRNLYNAALPCAVRGALMTVGQLAVYDQIKEILLQNDDYFADNWRTFFFASIIAGGTSTLISTPVELVGMQCMDANCLTYRGIETVVKRIIEAGGYRGLWRGVVLSFCKIVPQTVSTFLIYEFLRMNFGIEVK